MFQEVGARIVEPIEKLKNVVRIIRHHQEKYDGTGYPDGVNNKGTQFDPIVVDAFMRAREKGMIKK